MNRREFTTLVGAAAAWPLAARAQQTDRVWRVAVIGAVSPLPEYLNAFREALQQRGWTEGKNLSIDVRWPKDSFAQEPGLIPEILHSNVDVIVAWATPTALAARRATSTIPIVFLGISDPVGSGLAASLAHPGGNATGSSNVAPDLSAKLLETFAQFVPGMSSVGVVQVRSLKWVERSKRYTLWACSRKWSMQVRWKNTSAYSRVSRAMASTACYCCRILPTMRTQAKLPSLRSSTGCQRHFSYGSVWRRAALCRTEPILTTSSV